MISARTKSALAAAKARGVKLGGDRAGIIARIQPMGTKAGIKVCKERAQKRAADLLPVIEAIKAEGAVTLRQIASALDERGIHAPQGGNWSAVQVQRVLKTTSANLFIAPTQ